MTDSPTTTRHGFGPYSPEHAGKFTTATLPDGRRFGICSAAKAFCVAGHGFRPKDPDAFRGFRLDFFGRCQYRDARGGPPCGILDYFVRFGGADDPCLIVVEANAAILKRLSEAPTTLLQTFGLIGLLLPGVPLDLGPAAMNESRDPEAVREFQRRNAEEAERQARERNRRNEPNNEE